MERHSNRAPDVEAVRAQLGLLNVCSESTKIHLYFIYITTFSQFSRIYSKMANNCRRKAIDTLIKILRNATYNNVKRPLNLNQFKMKSVNKDKHNLRNEKEK